jgi:hypothetical protein
MDGAATFFAPSPCLAPPVAHAVAHRIDRLDLGIERATRGGINR